MYPATALCARVWCFVSDQTLSDPFLTAVDPQLLQILLPLSLTRGLESLLQRFHKSPAETEPNPRPRWRTLRDLAHGDSEERVLFVSQLITAVCCPATPRLSFSFSLYGDVPLLGSITGLKVENNASTAARPV